MGYYFENIHNFHFDLILFRGDMVERSWLRYYATNRKVVVKFPMRSLEFSIGVFLPAVLWPWGQLSIELK
jgi:hypothetical protein